MKGPVDTLRHLPVISLVAANAVTVFGVLFFGWDASGIVLFYWSENVAVGFYNILKLALLKVEKPAAGIWF